MKVPFLQTVKGKWSNINVAVLLLFIVALADIWVPFIPVGLQVYKVPFVLTIMAILRTFFSSGDPIQKSF